MPTPDRLGLIRRVDEFQELDLGFPQGSGYTHRNGGESYMNVEACLEDLENRIDPEVEDKLQAEWEAFMDGRFNGYIFSPKRSKQSGRCQPMS